MKKFILLSLLCQGLITHAQESDSPTIEGHYLGLQVNELVRQVLSFNSTNTPSNPYFFNYTFLSETGGGLNMSFALTVDKIASNDNFGNDITTDIDNVFFRIGYIKRKVLSNRFIYGLGIDLTLESQKNETENGNNFGGGTITTVTKQAGWGLGPRLTFSYKITDRIFIGTEANYYFKSLNEEFDVKFSNSSSSNETDETKIERFTFSAPAILWLTFRM